MGNENREKFEYVCRDYLKTLSLADLRKYGRSVGVEHPTERKKDDLVEDIIAILTGAAAPVKKNGVGAPVKNLSVDPTIPAQIAELKRRLLGEEAVRDDDTAKNGKSEEGVFDPSKEYDYKEIFRKRKEEQGKLTFVFSSSAAERIGQLEAVDGYACLLPLSGETDGERIFVPVKLIHAYDLREGDVLTCRVKKGDVTYVEEIDLVNDKPLSNARRCDFDEMAICNPRESVCFYNESENINDCDSVGKYLQWLLPVYKGQRGCVCSDPKAGKTELLYQMARMASALNPTLTVYVLLVGQSPETVMKYRKSFGENLAYTTYEEEPQRQVFTANFLLKRAKRVAENGKDVLLLVDSLSALARAYNDTEESSGGKTLAGGLESKTLQYLRKYFASARCFEKGGSLTVIGAASDGTGSPMDETVCAELCNMANLKISLNDTLAIKRIYPAIDLMKSYTEKTDALDETDILLRTEYLPAFGEQALRRMLETSKKKNELTEKIKRELKK